MIEENSKILNQWVVKLIDFAPTLVLAIITLFVGMFLAKIVSNIVSKSLSRKSVDPSLGKFLASITSTIFKIMVFISVLGILGIKTTSFIAILGSAGLAIGLALQGSLSNFAGGVIILLLKPFKVGNVITAQGFTGTVESINIFTTKLKTADNKVIYIPNAPLANGPITNVSEESTRRVDFTFGIGYGDNLKDAKNIILNTIANDSRVLQEPAPFIAVSELADSSVNFVVRVWTKAEDYWGVHFDGIENVKLALDENKISIPYPQTDIHVTQFVKQ